MAGRKNSNALLGQKNMRRTGSAKGAARREKLMERSRYAEVDLKDVARDLGVAFR